MSDKTFYILLLSMFILMGLVFGVLAGIVYNLVGSNVIFMAIAFGFALLFSILAVVSKTPMKGDKVFWSFSISIIFGILVPLFATF